ncbi:hypothetical protein BO70DRAFT_96267 [Aspergillus heteromorphus CBS 117.55]|uniref:ARM repeat-containing protein n=1 Tax=Aspergillus heteromorphus CBS 117.55 TaxID=1448321 RepID=A0A317VM08_9EURO|nr:uncharacterized protein BO70DRAFT_96267 [Aspergillus heteromorphus CBS 117.55]PWY75404.1 hypothetical protein BO70DRAFT_96267 [Aspergillus heteromorphus CBS 117.55]
MDALGTIPPDLESTYREILDKTTMNEDADVLRVLIDRREPDVDVNERLYLSAVSTMIRASPLKVMEALLNHSGPKFPFGEAIIQGAASHYDGLQMIKLFLLKKQAGFVVSSTVLAATAGNKNKGVEILELLINSADCKVPITEKVILKAALNEGSSSLAYLLELEGECQGRMLPFADRLLAAVVWREDTETLKIFFRRHPEVRVTKNMFLNATSSADRIMFLLQQPHDSPPVILMLELIEEDAIIN